MACYLNIIQLFLQDFEISKETKLYLVVYWSGVQVKSLAFQGLNLDKVRTFVYPLRPLFFTHTANIIVIVIVRFRVTTTATDL